MTRIIVALLALVFIAGPALAQKKDDDSPAAIEAREKRKAAQAGDQEYQATIKRMGKNAEQQAPADPWKNMRAPNATNGKQ